MKLQAIMLCICGILFFNGGIPVSAAEVDACTYDVIPRMMYIDAASANLAISSNGIATVKSAVYGISGITTNVAISARIERYQNGRWVTVRTFDKDSSLFYLLLSEQCQVSNGYTYRVVANVQAYTSSASEGRTVVSREVRY